LIFNTIYAIRHPDHRDADRSRADREAATTTTARIIAIKQSSRKKEKEGRRASAAGDLSLPTF
jgi:hypothetical protein